MGAGVTWANLQTALHLTNFPNFSPGTGFWYSPCGVGGGNTYTNNLNYALYIRGNLVTASGGTPPSCRPLATCTPSGNVLARAKAEGLMGSPTPTYETEQALGLSVVAAPNISKDDEPIKFLVNLQAAAPLQIILYNLVGEKVAELDAAGSPQVNTLTWALNNSQGEKVASGLYIYVLKSGNGVRTGKVVVLH